MLQIIKRYFWIALLVAGLEASWGFALLGPLPPNSGSDAWQTAVLGYQFAYTGYPVPGGPVWLGDIGGPRNIAEEYRRNIPVIYYTYDRTFLEFFGPEGAAAVDGAYAIMNTVPDADQMDLSLYPLESLHVNYKAQSDYLTDIRSVTLHALVEQMGLADPERFVWTLRARVVPPGCPQTTSYLVVQRNFDYLTSPLDQIQYSSYVNDVLYSYFIEEFCSAPNLAYTVPFSTDPEASIYTSVAANNFDGYGVGYLNNNLNQPTTLSGGLEVGHFYSGLTRDDAAGLKYLLRTNNVNYEYPDPTSLLFTVTTNYALQQLFPNVSGTNSTSTNGAGYYYFDGNTNGGFGYGDLAALIGFSKTNAPAAVQAAYPGLVISSVSNYFVMASNVTYSFYYTNAGPGSAYPPPQIFVVVTNYTPYWQFQYAYTFANITTNNYYTNKASLVSTLVGPPIGSPYGTAVVTNLTITTTNQIGGDFFVLPMYHTNVCPLDIISPGISAVLATTNLISGNNTNLVGATNILSTSNSVYLVTYFTNYSYVTHPVVCAEVGGTNAANYYQGIGRTRFVRADYDALISQTFRPITNYYTMQSLNTSNSQWQLQRFVRVITQPDILMNAQDEGAGNLFDGTIFRNINFTPSPALAGLAGPGTIDTPSTLTYNKLGDAFWNGDITVVTALAATNIFLNYYEFGQMPALAWASFDASTNVPVLYPNGTSIQNLENQLTVQLTPNNVPDGTNGVSYSVSYSASGGGFSPPFTWSATSIPGVIGSGLPAGLSVSSDGTLSGIPTASGTYSFILQLSDSLARTVQWTFAINIH